jgi:hypothetical protein
MSLEVTVGTVAASFLEEASCQRRNVSKQQYVCLVLSGHERGKRSLISPTQLAAYTSSATADNDTDNSARRPTASGTDP